MFKLIVTLFILVMMAAACGQEHYVDNIKKSRQEKDEWFRDLERTPLMKESISQFKGIPYFKINEDWRIKASFIRTPDEKPFDMPSTGEKFDVYIKYGIATFSIEGIKVELSVYQNQRLIQEQEFEDELFIPFKDQTSGYEAYGGGRYIDTKQPENDTIIIDFNQAYNPYCAYNYKYSCPIPPEENWMIIRIEAGEKYHDTWGL